MTDDTTPDEGSVVEFVERTAFLRYWRRSTPPNASEYDKHEANVSVPIPIPTEGVESQTFLRSASQSLADAKVLVWDALGIEYEFKDGMLVEKPQAVSGGGSGGGGSQPPKRTGSGGSEPRPDGAESCGVCGRDNPFDNRVGKRNPNAPDFKCGDKECGAGAWLKDDGTLGPWKARK